MKPIHAVEMARIHFVAKMVCVVMKILYLIRQLIMPMNVNAFVLITSQVCPNIAITLSGFNETDSPDFISFMMIYLDISN